MSFGKLLLLAAIITAVWVGVRMFGQVARAGAARNARRRQGRNGGRGPGQMVEAADMVRCPACDVYVATDAARCERPDCPPRR